MIMRSRVDHVFSTSLFMRSSNAQVNHTFIASATDDRGRCRCSKIMSPPNCNETMSPLAMGGDGVESKGTAKGEGNRERGARPSHGGRGKRLAATECAAGAAAEGEL